MLVLKYRLDVSLLYASNLNKNKNTVAFLYNFPVFNRYDWNVHHEEHDDAECSNQVATGYVPMVWGGFRMHGLYFDNDTEYVLGFNEPNQMDQAAMSPEEAALLWPDIERAAGNRFLVSPSPSQCNSSSTCIMTAVEWLDRFFVACDDCRVDYLSVHYYSCDAVAVMAYIDAMYNRYRKPIWLTEFSCPLEPTELGVKLFMRDILKRLDESPIVFRYSWFTTRLNHTGPFYISTNILNMYNSSLSNVGLFYNDPTSLNGASLQCVDSEYILFVVCYIVCDYVLFSVRGA